MTVKEVKNLPASVRQRLANLARQRGEGFQLVLEQFALERFLYRLSASPVAERFLLKGALLFRLWYDQPHRRTRDADLLGFGSADVGDMEKVFKDVCAIAAEDGIRFDAETVKGEEIREGMAYRGIRIRFFADLDGARVPVQFDIGFGDAVVPSPQEVEYPVLLDLPAPVLRVYPKYTVVAEKLEAMVQLGETNSRSKDFYDLYILARTLEFDGAILVRALRATFDRRGTAIPESTPPALTQPFAQSERQRLLWRAFLRRSALADGVAPFESVVGEIASFVLPALDSLRENRAFPRMWPPGGPWQEASRAAEAD